MSQEQIHVFDLLASHSFKTSIDNIAVKRHFYTLDLCKDQPSYAVEEALSALETKTKPLISELVENEVLFDESSKRSIFSRFLATLLMRSRQGLQMIYGFREEVQTHAAGSINQLPSPLVCELLGLNAEDMREFFAKSVVALASPLSAHIQAMHWRLLRAEEDYFITSENPIVIYNPTEERWGLCTPGSHIHIPISPRLLLHLGKEPTITGGGTFSLPKAGVKAANGLTVLAAEQYLLSHTSFEAIQDLIIDRAPNTDRAFGLAK